MIKIHHGSRVGPFLTNNLVSEKKEKLVKFAHWICNKCKVEIQLAASVGTKIERMHCPICREEWSNTLLEIIP